MSLSWEQGMRMAKNMKEHDPEIRQAILKCQRAQHGVVALRFTNDARDMNIEILDAPYEENVRVYNE